MADINPNTARANEEAAFDRYFVEETWKEKYGTDHPDAESYLAWITPLGDKLNNMFSEYERDRRETEGRWIKDLRQFRGEYDPEILQRLHKKRSKAYFSITRTKVKTVSARQTDLLFPANKDNNWGISTSPIPELSPTVMKRIMDQFQEQTGQVPTEEMIHQQINKEADRRCENMENEMSDQLSELRYREIIRNVILSGSLYGTGILKGPLVKEVMSKRWLPGPDGNWVTVEIPKMLPYCEFVPMWDIYPDMSAKTHDDMRGIFERHSMVRNKVFALAKRDDFNGDAIKSYLRANPNGDAEYKNHEQDLLALNPAVSESTRGFKETTSAGTSSLGTGSSMATNRGRYEVKEFWGYLSTDELAQVGVDVDEEVLGLDVAANVWMLGPVVIKAMISPIEGVAFPYHWYYYDKDDSSIWGEGIPSIMRDPQKLLNAAVRAMLDNAAMSAGPIIEVNTDLVDSSENPRDVYPFRVFLREGQGMEATAPAVRVYNVKSYTREFMSMIDFFMSASDEVTAIPRYMYGDTNNVGGAGKTASGLSMLMGAANVTLKDQVKNFDDGITKPFIKALYFWNMEFNDKEHIKGDFAVVAKGSSSLIAREVKAEAINQFLSITNNPTDLMFTRRDNVLRELVKIMDLDDMELIKGKNQVAIEQESRNKQMEEDKAFEQKLQMMKADSGGHTDGGQAKGGGGEIVPEGGLTPGLGNPQEEVNV